MQRVLPFFSKLVSEWMVMEERISVVDSEIQRLEEQLLLLKAEKATLADRLSIKVEEMEKTSHEIEDSRDQLVNSHMCLGEPHRISTIMQTYFSRVIALAEDVKLLD